MFNSQLIRETPGNPGSEASSETQQFRPIYETHRISTLCVQLRRCKPFQSCFETLQVQQHFLVQLETSKVVLTTLRNFLQDFSRIPSYDYGSRDTISRS